MMAELRFWLCLFILACVRIRHTHGWFWFDDSKETEKGVQTPAYLTTVGPTSLPRTEPSRTTGTSASVTEEVAKEVSFEGKPEVRSRSGLGIETESESGSGSSSFERQHDVYVTSSDQILSIIDEYVSLHDQVTKVEQTDGLDPANSRFNESVNVSFTNITAKNNVKESNSAEHANTTLYSSEYAVSDNALTIESEFLVASMPASVEPLRCLAVDSDLPFCTRMGVESFSVPNFLNQSSVEEIRTVLTEWAWLLRSDCHHSLEWFFCLLLTPRCGQSGPSLPCRSSCEVLRDSCWTLLDEGRLPVKCNSLPEEKHDGYRCLSVSNLKGNGRLECHLSLSLQQKERCIFNQCHLSVCLFVVHRS